MKYQSEKYQLPFDNNFVDWSHWNPETGTIDYDPNDSSDEPIVGYRTVGVASIGVELRLPNGDVVCVNPDDYVTEMVVELPDHYVRTISGRLRTVCGSSRYQNFMPRFYNPMGPQLSNWILPQMLVIDQSEAHEMKLSYVPIFSILSVGEIQPKDLQGVIIVGPGPQYAKLQDVINNADEGSVIELLSGDYEGDLFINRNVTLKASGRATLHGKIEVGTTGEDKKLEVTLTGLDLTDNATITVNHATSFIMTNCVVYDLDLIQKTMPIAFVAEEPCYIEICDNTFKKCNNFSYNLIDVYAALTESSKINNNRFEKGCCTHNTISLYGLDKNADVQCNDNFCEESKNMLRIGFKGESNGRIEVLRNCYNETDTDPLYAGLVIIQPYGTQTTNMFMLDISISDTINNTQNPQTVYMYSGPKDLKFTSATKPKIYVDGYFTDIPYIEIWPDGHQLVGSTANVGLDGLVVPGEMPNNNLVPGFIVGEDEIVTD